VLRCSDGLDSYAQLGCRIIRLAGAKHHAWISVIPEHGHARCIGDNLAEEFESLRAQLRGQQREARCVSARVGEAGHDPSPDRITDAREDDRDRVGTFRAARAAGVLRVVITSTFAATSSNANVYRTCERLLIGGSVNFNGRFERILRRGPCFNARMRRLFRLS
jgi:hypothetical protein